MPTADDSQSILTGAYDPERARRRAKELVAAGFTTIKVKVGVVPVEDVERVRIVRETIGPDIALTIDANGGWDIDTAIRCIRELEPCHLDLVEQPIPAGDYTGLARVRKETGERSWPTKAALTSSTLKN